MLNKTLKAYPDIDIDLHEIPLTRAVATTIKTDGRGGVIVVCYRGTDVLKTTGKMIALDNGGWITKTTARRINDASVLFGLGIRVRVKANKYRVDYDFGRKSIPWNGKTLHLVRPPVGKLPLPVNETLTKKTEDK